MFAGLGVPSMCASGLPPCSLAQVGQQCTSDVDCVPRMCASGLPVCSGANVGEQCTPDEQCDYVIAGSAAICPDGSYPLPGMPCPSSAPGLVQKITNTFGPQTIKTGTGTTRALPWWSKLLLGVAVIGGGVFAYRHIKR